MEATEQRAERVRMPARPRINIKEEACETGESWHRQAIILYRDVVRLVGEEPTADCERWGSVSSCRRRHCDPCSEWEEWEDAIRDIVREATDWGLHRFGCDSAYDCTGRQFSHGSYVTRLPKHPGVVMVSWSGGRDI